MKNEASAIIITGGGQGIGKGLVAHFGTKGWHVLFVDRDAEAGDETAHQYAGSHFMHGDVTEAGFAKRAIDECLRRFGRLDALINNAGVSEFVPIDDMTLDQFRRVIEINLVAYYAWTKATVAALRDTRGAVVNIASTRAIQSEPSGEAYAAAKGGVVALTHALAVSLGPLVRVNAISPGWIEVGAWQKSSAKRSVEHSDADRQQHPVGRVGTVEDIAHLADYLCGRQSGFVTGQNFVIDGGMTKKMIYV